MACAEKEKISDGRGRLRDIEEEWYPLISGEIVVADVRTKFRPAQHKALLGFYFKPRAQPFERQGGPKRCLQRPGPPEVRLTTTRRWPVRGPWRRQSRSRLEDFYS